MDLGIEKLINGEFSIMDLIIEKLRIEERLEAMELDKNMLKEQLDLLLDQDGSIHSISGGGSNHTTSPETGSITM